MVAIRYYDRFAKFEILIHMKQRARAHTNNPNMESTFRTFWVKFGHL